ncbi:hypothetical protein EDD29_4209 [Actinocorallia herbida]|uniref:Uncharacterized protein n=1 Tax=Actinocorallia herbida TaxID=58109 RepID=A0A3N1CZC5_9ACTN|nr:WD40 repeat domain-containing protein [Actinocorallia herbida]ROO86635.1 hypothetical protein EDD29_4209 [Actinocorallia herbida]
MFAGVVDRTVKCWDAATGLLLWSVAEGRDRSRDLMFVRNADGSVALAGATGRGLRSWNPFVGEEIVSPIAGGIGTSSWGGRLGRLRQGELPGGDVVIVAPSHFCEVLRWDAHGNPFGEPLRTECPVLAVEVQKGAEGQTVIIGSSDDEIVRYWDLESGRPLGRPLDIGMAANRIAFGALSDGKKVLAVCEEGGVIAIWDVRAGAGAKPVLVDCDAVLSAAVHDLSFVVVEGEVRLGVSFSLGHEVRHWNPVTGRYLGRSFGSGFFRGGAWGGEPLGGVRLADHRIHIGPAESVLCHRVPESALEVRLT